METTIEQVKQKVRAWAQANADVVLYDDESSQLLDVSSGRSVTIRWRDLSDFQEKIHPETKESYLVLLFEDGKQIALANPGGVAFAPSTENTGDLRDLPPVVCLRDFLTLKQRVDHYLYEHPDEPPRECLDMVLICIATLDGARAVGFDVGDLEQELEKSLGLLEQRAS